LFIFIILTFIPDFVKAQLSGSSDELKQVISENRRTLEKDPENLNALMNLAEGYYQSGRYRECISYCNILDSFSKNSLQQPDSARRTELLNKTPYILHLRGKAYHKAGEFEKAENDYLYLYRNHPVSRDLLLDLGNLAYNRNKYDSAIQYIREGIIKYPEDYRFYFNLANVYYATREYPASKDLYRQSLFMYPSYSPASFYLGTLMEQENQYDSAIYYYTKAIQSDSSNFEYFFRRARSRFMAEEYISSLDDLEITLTLKPGFEEAIKFTGLIYYQLKDYQKAVHYFELFITTNDHDWEVYGYMALAKLELKNYAESEEEFTRAIRLKPDHGKLYYFRGISRIKLGLKQEACKDFADSIRKNYKPKNSRYIKKCNLVINRKN
jgi:tetratricopeptide (TPR) repeat protein